MNTNTLIIVIVVLVAVVAFYLINKSNATRVADAAAVVAANTPPPCVPFTKAQQDQEKREAQTKCYKFLLNPIPLLGKKQFSDCLHDVELNLTPVNNC